MPVCAEIREIFRRNWAHLDYRLLTPIEKSPEMGPVLNVPQPIQSVRLGMRGSQIHCESLWLNYRGKCFHNPRKYFQFVKMRVLFLCLALGLGADATTRIKVTTSFGTTRLNDLTWKSWTAAGVYGGGAVHFEPMKQDPTSHVILEHCNFSGCTNGGGDAITGDLQGGGAVSVDYCVLTSIDTVYEYCVAKSGWGGAILCRRGPDLTSTIQGGMFSDCSCNPTTRQDEGGGGGAICGREQHLVVQSVAFKATCPQANKTHDGGCILARNGLECVQSGFYSCATKGGKGGAIWASGDSNISWCTFLSCNGSDAGAIWFESGTTCVLEHTRINECYGGGNTVSCLSLSATDFVFDDVNISVSDSSKPLAIFKGDPTTISVTNCNIDGGGPDKSVFNPGQCMEFPTTVTTLEIVNTTFKGFSKNHDGGGAFRFDDNWTKEKSVTFDRCVFEKVEVRATDRNGGAISFAGQNRANARIISCSFKDCSSTGAGGAVFVATSTTSCEIVDCVFTSNNCGESFEGGSLWLGYGRGACVCRNCTFEQHTAKQVLFVEFLGEGTPELLNLSELVFVSNSWSNGALVSANRWPATIIYSQCKFKELTLGTGASVSNENSTVCNIIECEFEDCEAQESLVNCAGSGGESATLEGCRFTGCTSKRQQLITVTWPQVYVRGCHFRGCDGAGSTRVMALSCDEVTFSDNVVEYSGSNGQPQQCVIAISSSSGPISLVSCEFLYSGAIGEFIELGNHGTSVLDFSIVDCHVEGQGGSFSRGWLVWPNSYGTIRVIVSTFEKFSKNGQGGGAFRFTGDSNRSPGFVEITDRVC